MFLTKKKIEDLTKRVSPSEYTVSEIDKGKEVGYEYRVRDDNKCLRTCEELTPIVNSARMLTLKFDGDHPKRPSSVPSKQLERQVARANDLRIHSPRHSATLRPTLGGAATVRRALTAYQPASTLQSSAQFTSATIAGVQAEYAQARGYAQDMEVLRENERLKNIADTCERVGTAYTYNILTDAAMISACCATPKETPIAEDFGHCCEVQSFQNSLTCRHVRYLTEWQPAMQTPDDITGRFNRVCDRGVYYKSDFRDYEPREKGARWASTANDVNCRTLLNQQDCCKQAAYCGWTYTQSLGVDTIATLAQMDPLDGWKCIPNEQVMCYSPPLDKCKVDATGKPLNDCQKLFDKSSCCTNPACGWTGFTCETDQYRGTCPFEVFQKGQSCLPRKFNDKGPRSDCAETLSCRKNTDGDYTCQECHSTCKTCYDSDQKGDNGDNCASCKHNGAPIDYFVTEGYFWGFPSPTKLRDIAIQTSGEHTTRRTCCDDDCKTERKYCPVYILPNDDSRDCRECHPSCSSCSGPLPNHCTACDTGEPTNGFCCEDCQDQCGR